MKFLRNAGSMTLIFLPSLKKDDMSKDKIWVQINILKQDKEVFQIDHFFWKNKGRVTRHIK